MTRLSLTRRAAVAAALVTAVLLAGCGGDDDDSAAADDSPATTEADETTTTAAEDPTETTAPAPTGPTLTVTPADGLTDGQLVDVAGSGFTPNHPLVVAQCSETSAGPADCNTAGAAFVQTGPDGSLTAQLTVKIGSIGTAGAICDHATPCSIGSTDISNPTGPDLSRARITFAG